MNRRRFLKAAGGLGGAFSLAVYSKSATADMIVADMVVSAPTGLPVLDGFSPWIFIDVGDDNKIALTHYKLEMGQGTSTGLAMIFADELGADFKDVSLKSATMDDAARSQSFRDKRWGDGTGGSGGQTSAWQGMLESGAAVRHMFLQAAAKRWSVSPGLCRIESSIIHGPGDVTLTLGALAQEAASSRIPEPSELKLKSAKEHTIIGKSQSNLYQKDYVTGAKKYTMDTVLPGMVYAAIARCPVYNGKLVSFDDSKARAMPGVLDVIEVPGWSHQGDDRSRAGVAVIAKSTWQAFQAKEALIIKWNFGSNASRSLDTIGKELSTLPESARKEVQSQGDFDRAFANANSSLEAEYTSHYQENATMEPLVAVAHQKDGKMEVWAPCQWAGGVAKDIAAATTIKREDITVHLQSAGGSFGRKYHLDYTTEVGFLAARRSDPVMLTWTREDCMQAGLYHSYARYSCRAAFDKKNTIVGTRIDMYGGSRHILEDYRLGPNIKITTSEIDPLLGTGAWRAVTEHRNTLARECFIDEIASYLSQDPIDYRLARLRDPATIENPDQRLRIERAFNVLREVRERSEWDKPLKPGYARGVALSPFGNTYVAEVATVRIYDGGFKVEKVVCVADSGEVLNPQAAKGQLEGSIIWALSALIHGGIDVQDGQVQQSNFHDYPVLRIDETPEMEIYLLESKGPRGGFGEPGVPPLAPAVLNAYFAATGKRVRTIPMRWDKETKV